MRREPATLAAACPWDASAHSSGSGISLANANASDGIAQSVARTDVKVGAAPVRSLSVALAA